jgi:hypothetical protein
MRSPRIEPDRSTTNATLTGVRSALRLLLTVVAPDVQEIRAALVGRRRAHW